MKNSILIALFLVLTISFASAQPTVYQQQYTYIGPPLALQFRQLVQSANEVKQSNLDISTEIKNARMAYYNARKNGQKDVQPLGERYFRLLFGKDFMCYQNYSFDRTMAKGEKRNTTAMEILFGKIDGGIYPICLESFQRWVDTMDYHVGQLVKGNIFNLTSETYVQALEKSSDTYNSYRIIRDWVDQDFNGIKYSGKEGMKAYAMAMIHGYSGKSGIKANENIYAEMVEVFGEDYVLQTFERYRSAPKKVGDYLLKDFATATSLGLYNQLEPWGTIQELLGRGALNHYIMGKIYWHGGPCIGHWKLSQKRFQLYQTVFGKTIVDDLVREIALAPKDIPNPAFQGERLTKAVADARFEGCIDPYQAFEVTLKHKYPEAYFKFQMGLHFDLNALPPIQEKFNELVAIHGREKLLTTIEDYVFNRPRKEKSAVNEQTEQQTAPLRRRTTTANGNTPTRTRGSAKGGRGRRAGEPYEAIMEMLKE